MTEKRKPRSNGVRGTVRRLYLATVGGFAVAEEETEKLLDRLVKKGEEAESEGKQLVRERIDERREEAKKQAEEFEEQIDERVETVLNRMNLPSKSDVRELNKQIEQLSKKVDELKKAEKEEGQPA